MLYWEIWLESKRAILLLKDLLVNKWLIQVFTQPFQTKIVCNFNAWNKRYYQCRSCVGEAKAEDKAEVQSSLQENQGERGQAGFAPSLLEQS